MQLTKLGILNRKNLFQNKFGGYEHTASTAKNCFYDMLNLSSEALPGIGCRKKRAWYTESDDVLSGNGGTRVFADDNITAVGVVEDRICYCSSDSVWFRDYPVANADLDTSVSHRQVVPFGRGCFIIPDGKYIVPKINPNVSPDLHHASFSVSCTGATVNPCSATGGNISVNYYSTTEPTGATTGECWLNLSEDIPHFYYYVNGSWTMGQRAYVIIRGTGLGKYAVNGDELVIDGMAIYSPKVKVFMRGNNYIIFTECWSPEIYGTKNVTASKKMPKLDFAVEHLNRLWGCRYGLDENGNFVNEIYASKAGDPTCWDIYNNISTDPYAVSLGCTGEFTGVAKLGSELIFFKENCMVRITGSVPADFGVTVVPCRGVKKGEDKSIVLLNEKIFYMGLSGIQVYDGTLPYCISSDLGTDNFRDCAAGAQNAQYRIAMTDTENKRCIYVFDTESGYWFKEDDEDNTRFFVRLSDCLYGICLPPDKQEENVSVYAFYAVNPEKTVSGNIFSCTAGDEDEYTYTEEEDFDWFAESGKLGTDTAGTQSLRSMAFRIEKPYNGYFSIGIKSGGQPEFKCLCSIQGKRQGAFGVTVNTPRCDSYTVKLWGKGCMTVFSRTLITEKTGEVIPIDE